MDKEKTKQTKEKKEQPEIKLMKESSSEVCRIGEVFLSSEVVDVRDLVSIALGIIANQEVKKYLKLIDVKTSSGSYLG